MNKNHNPTLSGNARALRRRMTPEERRLWYDFLKNAAVTVQRQKVIGPYIVDFYIAACNLVIELDGFQHGEGAQLIKDERRDAFLAAQGLTVLRYSNHQIKQNFRDVCEDIALMIEERLEMKEG